MQSALYVALSAQVAIERRLNTLANNVANLGTGGYRAEEVKFETVLTGHGRNEVAFASTGATFTSLKPGPLTHTGGSLDVAVQGDAWLAFNGPRGPVYTRDGRMKLTEAGELQTLSGRPILDSGGAPLMLDPAGGPPMIGRDGTITQNGIQVGQIGLFTIDRASPLQRVEGAGVIPEWGAEMVQDFTAVGLQQGSLEGANVNPIAEMTRLIAIQRLFESTSAGLSQMEASLDSTVRTLGPTS